MEPAAPRDMEATGKKATEQAREKSLGEFRLRSKERSNSHDFTTPCHYSILYYSFLVYYRALLCSNYSARTSQLLPGGYCASCGSSGVEMGFRIRQSTVAAWADPDTEASES